MSDVSSCTRIRVSVEDGDNDVDHCIDDCWDMKDLGRSSRGVRCECGVNRPGQHIKVTYVDAEVNAIIHEFYRDSFDLSVEDESMSKCHCTSV